MIKLIKSTFYKEEETKRQLIEFVRKTKQLSFGPQCEAFEKKFSKWQGRKHSIFVNSGSSANLAILQALLNLGRLRPRDLIGFSSLTWSTNVMPIIELGLCAVPIDINKETLNVSSITFLQAISKYPIKLLFLTNALGFCDDIETIYDICQKRNILLLEDNCESLGTVYKGKKLGNFSLGSTFSFYVGHHMSTIEGGAILTDDEELATMLRLVRAHGWDRNLDFAHRSQLRRKFKINSNFYSRYTFYDLGYNLRPTEINGFIGNVQLSHIDKVIQKRNKIFLTIAKKIYARNDLYYPIRYNHIDFVSNFAIPVVCKTKKLRNALVKKCKGIIEIRPIIGGDMTRQPFFGKYMKHMFPKRSTAAQIVHEQGLYFGNNPELTPVDIATIVKTFTQHIS